MMRAFDRVRTKRAADGLPLRIGVIRAERLRWVNDTFGTTAGDDVLRAAADRLKVLRRPEQIVGRWGGEEFVILMPGISEDDAARWLERAVAGLQSLEFRTPDGRRFCAAFTAGLAESAPAGIVSDPADSAARMLLYLVRVAGHCRVMPDGHGEGFDRHALLVEDDAVTAKLLIGLLRLDGFEVEHVTDGKAAVDAAMRTPAGLVVLDVRLPGLDGFEVIREVRRMPGYDRSPILIVSGARESRDIVRGLELGADDYVIKPFSPVEIRARVRRLLARH